MIRRNKICIVAPGHWLHVMGGAQYQTQLLVRALAATGRWDISYIARNTGDGPDPDDHRLIRIRNRCNKSGAPYCDAVHVFHALKAEAPDVIYLRGSSAYAGPAAWYARKTGARILWHVASDADVTPFRLRLTKHAIRNFIDRQLFEYSLLHTNVIVTQTMDQARLLEQHHGLRHTAIVRNFHPLPKDSIRKSLQAEVVWVGNLKPLKQPEVFLRLAAALKEQTDARFVMIGGTQGSARWLTSVMQAIESTPNVSYRGASTQEEVNHVLARAAVLVNTSTHEGFSNTFIQAWMRRTPVVSLTVNPDGLLSSGQLGLHSGNEAQLANDVLRLLRDRNLRDRMGIAAQTYALANHSLDNVNQLVALIDSCAR